MRTQQLCWTEARGWHGADVREADLVLYFGTRGALASGSRYGELREMFPQAHILGCSTGGQIRNDDIGDDEIAAVALRFDATRLRLAREAAARPEHSRNCGEAIGRALKADKVLAQTDQQVRASYEDRAARSEPSRDPDRAEEEPEPVAEEAGAASDA